MASLRADLADGDRQVLLAVPGLLPEPVPVPPAVDDDLLPLRRPAHLPEDLDPRDGGAADPRGGPLPHHDRLEGDLRPGREVLAQVDADLVPRADGVVLVPVADDGVHGREWKGRGGDRARRSRQRRRAHPSRPSEPGTRTRYSPGGSLRSARTRIPRSSRASMSRSARRFTFARYCSTSGWTVTSIVPPRRLAAAAWTSRRIWMAAVSAVRTAPEPPQARQGAYIAVFRPGPSRCRVISISPKGPIRPIRTRARSSRRASRSARSTSRRWRACIMSMKSITICPPRSRRRIWRTISGIASRFVRKAVSSRSDSLR